MIDSRDFIAARRKPLGPTAARSVLSRWTQAENCRLFFKDCCGLLGQNS